LATIPDERLALASRQRHDGRRIGTDEPGP
jgi:hypothetical protein